MFLMILGPSAFQLRSKIDKKASPDRSKINQNFGQHLDPIFDASWRPTWLPRPSQNPPKIDQKSMKNGPKNHSYFLNPSWSQCGTILVQLLGHLVPTWPNLLPTWHQLGPNLGPTWLQSAWDTRMGRMGYADGAPTNFDN